MIRPDPGRQIDLALLLPRHPHTPARRACRRPFLAETGILDRDSQDTSSHESGRSSISPGQAICSCVSNTEAPSSTRNEPSEWTCTAAGLRPAASNALSVFATAEWLGRAAGMCLFLVSQREGRIFEILDSPDLDHVFVSRFPFVKFGLSGRTGSAVLQAADGGSRHLSGVVLDKDGAP